MKKRLLSLLLAVIMVLSIVPTVALAAGEGPEEIPLVTVTKGENSTEYYASKLSEYGMTQGSNYNDDGRLLDWLFATQLNDSDCTVTLNRDTSPDMNGFVLLGGGSIDYASVTTGERHNIVLDLNGHTMDMTYTGDDLSGSHGISVYNANLTIQDSSTTQTGKIKSHYRFVVMSYSNSVIEVTGGSLLSDYNQDPLAGIGISKNGSGTEPVTVTLKGGTFSGSVPQAAANEIPEGYTAVDNGDGTFTVSMVKAKIGDTGYDTLQAAINAAGAGDTVEVLAESEEKIDLTALSKSKGLMYFFNPEYKDGKEADAKTNAAASGVVFVKDTKNTFTDTYTYECELRTYNSEGTANQKLSATKTIFYGDMETLADLYAKDNTTYSTDPKVAGNGHGGNLVAMITTYIKDGTRNYSIIMPNRNALNAQNTLVVEKDMILSTYSGTGGRIDFRLMGSDAFTLDLNGHEIYQVSGDNGDGIAKTSDGAAALRLSAFTDMTIVDSATGGSVVGSLAAVDYFGDYSYGNGGKLTLGSGALIGRMVPSLSKGDNDNSTISYQDDNEKGSVIRMDDTTCTFIMNGGTLDIDRHEYRRESTTKLWKTAAAIQVTGDCDAATITLNGGSIELMPEDQQAPTNLETDYPEIIYRDVIATVTKTVSDNVKFYYGKVAKIENGSSVQYFDTLAAAFDAAANGQTVVLLNDADITTGGLTAATGKDFILDLNGHSIKTGEQHSNNIQVNGKLTLVDSAENSTGKIYTEEEYTTNANKGVIFVSGEFVMDSGKIEAVIASDPENKGQYGIILNTNCKVTINGGEIKAGWYAVATNGSDNRGNTEIVVNGGTLISTNDYAIYNPAINSKVTVNGGTVYGENGGIFMNRGLLTVNGGTITSKGQGTTGVWGDGTGGANNAAININAGYAGTDAIIKGGKIIAEGDAVILGNGANGKITVIGGTFTSDPSTYVPDGYFAENNQNGTWTVKPYEVRIEPATVNETGEIVSGKTTDEEGHEIDKVIEVKTVEGTEVGTEDKTAAAQAITSMVDNDAVSMFMETNIDNATKELDTTADGFNISMVLDAIRKEANKGGTNEASATADGQITVSEQTFTDVDVDKKINVELEAAKVEIKTETAQAGTKTTTVNGATYDVKPTATITKANGEKITAVISNDAITKPITFRLPIDKKLGDSGVASTAVWHSDDANNFKKDYLGIFDIQKEGNEYFVELSASEFSYYTYENLTEITNSNIVAIKDNAGKFYGFDTLGEAITAFDAGSGANTGTAVYNAVGIVLLKDINGTDAFDFGEKVMSLDLNGCKLVGAVTNAASVTVSNTGAKQNTLAATGIYNNDVSEFVADGYDTRKTTVENDTVINTHDIDYTVIVNAVATDRDTENGNQSGRVDEKADVNLVDVYAGDIVTVSVTVNGARFVAADLTLKYDPTLFEEVTLPEEMPSGWKREADKNQYRFTATGGDQYFEDGTVIGTFKFKAKAVGEDLVAQNSNVGWFKVYDKTSATENQVRDIFVSDSWSSGYFDPSEALNETHAINDYVNIIMMPSMTGGVDAASGLVYNATAQQLVKHATFSAKVDSVDITQTADAKIEYCLSDTAVTGDAAIKALTYSDTVPTGIHAGTYYVYYKISAPGYTSVYGNRSVTIAKKQVTLTWSFDNETNKNTFERTYNNVGFTNPTATFNLQGVEGTENAIVTMKTLDGVAVADDTTLKAVGTYVFEASYSTTEGEGENAKTYNDYTFTPNPTATVTIEGQPMNGWSLEGAPTQYIDGKDHSVAILTLNTGVEDFGPDANATGLQITFRYSDDNGATWTDMGPYTSDDDLTVTGAKNAYEKAVAAIPVESLEGTYKMEMTVKADTYETTTFPITTFNIKKPVYVVEASEYVAGWTEIRVYTNETVTFRYGDDESNMLYDVTSFGYRYNNVQSYLHVYALVVEGEANLGKIYASNEAAKSVYAPTECTEANGNKIYDVNTVATDENKNAHVELEDAVAAQSVYNVNADYLKNPEKMYIVLRCDVNRDKKVDVAGDVTAILNEYVTNWNK